MKPDNQSLLDEPKKFFKTFSVKSSDGINGAVMKQLDSRLGSFHSQVKKKNLVSYLNVEARARFGRQLAMRAPKGTYTQEQLGEQSANEGADTITVQAYAENKVGRVPAFFLPWDTRGGAVEMTIPKKTATDTDATYPRLFLTAAINGCSVFVRGNRDNPCVTHCGIGTGTDDAVTRWRDLVEDISGLQGNALLEVNKTHYVKGVGVQDKKGFSSTTHAAKFEKVLDKHYQGTDIQIEETFPWGAVFGLCDDNGLWTFYLQENITITYRRLKAQQARKWWQKKPKPSWDDLQVARPIAVRKFFPASTGLVKLQSRYSWRSLHG